MDNDNTVVLHIRLPRDVADTLAEFAQQRGVSLTSCAQTLLRGCVVIDREVSGDTLATTGLEAYRAVLAAQRKAYFAR